MIVVGGWPGRIVVGLNGAFGVRPAAFSVDGSFDNPFLNDVDGGDDTTEFVAVVSALPGSGTVTLTDAGGFSHTGAADGSYLTTFDLYTWAQGGPLTRHTPAEQIATTFGEGGGSTFTVSSAGVAAASAVGTPTVAFTAPGTFVVSPPGLSITSAMGTPTIHMDTPDADTDLIVEDGTGLADADSYASVAFADTYHASRGNAAWADLAPGDKDVKLRLATDYLQERFSGRWAGQRLTGRQALDWPRYGVVVDSTTLPADEVPARVQRACSELALKAIGQPLTADEGGQVKSEKIGPLEVVYADGARQQVRFAAVEALLAPLLVGGPGFGSIRLVRA